MTTRRARSGTALKLALPRAAGLAALLAALLAAAVLPAASASAASAAAAAATRAGEGGGGGFRTNVAEAAASEGASDEHIFDDDDKDGTSTTVVLSNGNDVSTLNSKVAVEEEQSKQRMKAEAAVKKKEVEQYAKREEARVKGDTGELSAKADANKKRLDAKTVAFRRALEEKEKAALRTIKSQQEKLDRQNAARLARVKQLAARKAREHRARTQMLAKAHKQMEAAGGGVPSLSRGWRNYGGGWQRAGVYLVAGRVAVLQGLLRGTAVRGLVARLAPPVRPKGGRLIFQVLVRNQPARLDVLPDGRVYLVASAGPGAWISLDGVAYDVTKGGSAEVRTVSNWQAYGNSYAGPSQTRVGGACMLSGLIRAGEWNKVMLQLANDKSLAGCMPVRRMIFTAPHHTSVQRVDLTQNPRGALVGVPAAPVRHNWVSLDGLSWTAGFGRPVSLDRHWTNYGNGYLRVSYAKVDDTLCVLSGLAKYRHGRWHPKNRVIARLPAGCRPRRRLLVAANAHERAVRLDILPDGRVLWITGSRHGWVSFGGIKFIAFS